MKALLLLFAFLIVGPMASAKIRIEGKQFIYTDASAMVLHSTLAEIAPEQGDSFNVSIACSKREQSWCFVITANLGENIDLKSILKSTQESIPRGTYKTFGLKGNLHHLSKIAGFEVGRFQAQCMGWKNCVVTNVDEALSH